MKICLIYTLTSFIYSIKIVPLVPRTYLMDEFDLSSDYKVDSDFFLKYYGCCITQKLILNKFYCLISRTCGFFYLDFSKTQKIVTKKLFLSKKDLKNNNKQVNLPFYEVLLGQNNILRIVLPVINTINTSESTSEVSFCKTNCCSNNCIQLSFIEYIILNKENIIKCSKKIIKDLIKGHDSCIRFLLDKKDYILTFFSRDFALILKFFEDFVKILAVEDTILPVKLCIFFDSFLKNNMNNFWTNLLIDSKLEFDYFKKNSLYDCFFSDIYNLINLIENFQYKFTFFEKNRSKILLNGKSIILIELELQEKFNESTCNFEVCDDSYKKLYVDYMTNFNKTTIYFMLNNFSVQIFNINRIHCAIFMPDKIYMANNIEISHLLQ
ncbi:hypothetical protein NCER_101974 [Vairimorpha ceranae BRL01]|uniref:Uncharacterized protein n=2 Tax=Vairimorpha ceranae TaxID=40302 RepID=C4VB52_VAIC1|nr:hypothetical protein AAJ76_1500062863 [Vairimorpha ceranae]EEQ81550.1 hypothetical protein NCER_101974 [Vairimorpha ceranae BRL01]KAF5140429.1 hypothetical protein G9O61_00g012340 [Vairimorpha ceranae]KAF5140734.1 hypothetical protein G9O61_00g012300 [Vairimorpha ceranae]KKO75671.1 hypothetical protein AAJ76_1500062863 [Vairimorpha ceranae]